MLAHSELPVGTPHPSELTWHLEQLAACLVLDELVFVGWKEPLKGILTSHDGVTRALPCCLASWVFVCHWREQIPLGGAGVLHRYLSPPVCCKGQSGFPT
ncbi:pleckstrin homology domain-containing family A member 5 [Platysternon megacephalum]|uniref:Pleckstrin homology domain-containing family A member 5 n=1 Tax=Platysternon megacephalum TaxID=55544 RepID=A0A4D9EGI2_9SAUR|nr:pleckstrin homology domain-containing family A member 5 [Platysternon megacephalum]